MTFSRWLWIPLTGLLLNACTTFEAYDGPVRPDREVATVKASMRVVPLLLVNFVSINSVQLLDGKRVNAYTTRLPPGEHWFGFTPGAAVVVGGYGGGGVIPAATRRSCAFKAEVRASHTYTLTPGSLKLPAGDSAVLQNGTVRLSDDVKWRRARKTTIPVICHIGAADFCRTDAECPAKEPAAKCVIPDGQPIGICTHDAP
ncbi:MAG TPA: hypothetical protein VFW49_00850 [Fluviicoccus sp.]|nr:hypothetical protein [Fluviicoccus sp.]